MINIIITIALGVVAGVLSGMFGIGGGVVIVPSLIILFSLQLQAASGTSLAALLLPVGIFACMKFYKAGYLSIRTSAYIAIGLLAGVFFGAKLVTSIPNDLLKQFYGIFLLYVSYIFIQPLELLKLKKVKEIDESQLASDANPILLIVLGAATGVLSGMFGIGGGLVITPFLMAVLKFHPKKAIGTSLGALLLPVGLPGVIVYHQAGNINLEFAICIAIGMVFGSILGAKITLNLPAKNIKRAYGFFLLLIALDFLFRGLIAARV